MDRNAFTLDEDELPAIDVRLTPRPDEESDTLALDGTWRFTSGPEDRPPVDGADWRRHEVPGQWNLAGFDVPDERGWYRRTVSVPAAWNQGRIILRFDAVYSDAVIFVQGERVADHVGGYTPFEVDLTDHVTPGERFCIDVGVSEESIADEISQAGYGGGITRSVTLFRAPSCHVSDLDVDTTQSADYTRATVSAVATVSNASTDPVDEGVVQFTLTNPDGETVARNESEIDGLEAESDCEVAIEFDLDSFESWNPDEPNLYDLDVELRADGEHERVNERVGIRQIEIDGNDLLLNGQPVTLRGVNWREVDPDRGISIDPEKTRRDVERLRAANVNYIRTGHHPPSSAFVEACDDVGIVLEMESPVAFLRFENAFRADDESIRDVVGRQLLEIVERDKNRPSVCIWSLSNESEWGSNFEAAARLVRAADPTRPLTFNWGKHRDADEPFVDVANHHYPTLRRSMVPLDHFDGHDRPVLFDEYAHTYCYNGTELNTDPGLRDDYARVIEAAWDRVREIDACVGAAIWAGLDHLIPEYRWGIFDKFRRARPEYWHVKKTYAPVQLGDVEWGEDETVQIVLENEGDFVDLSAYTIEWSAGDESGTATADARPHERGIVDVSVPDGATDLSLRVRHPTGFTVNEFYLERRAASTNPPTETDAEPSLSETEAEIQLQTDVSTLTVDRNSGWVDISVDGESVVSGYLGLAITPQQDGISVPPVYDGKTIGSRLNPWRCEDVDVLEDALGVEIRGGYYYDKLDRARGSMTISVRPDGCFDFSYDFVLQEDHNAREVGLALPLARECETLTWDREGYWTTYPDDHIGRETGTARAFPGEVPAAEPTELDRTRPWHLAVTPRGTNDFRSTKRNVYTARLTDDGGRGVEVRSDSTQHVRCAVGGDETELLVLDRSLAGVGLALLDRNTLLDEEPVLPGGTRLQGTATIHAGRFE